MRNYYQDYKELHDSIKPIRGRAEDVRPIGARRRDWERIEMDGDVVACRLYNTQCVRYYPDGRIGVRTGSWSTPLTADFIHTHSPWQCYKRNNKLWVMVPDFKSEKNMFYPVPDNGELQFECMGVLWKPVGDVVIEKMVVNRERAKEVRAPCKPFLGWAKAFLSMSDGWIMHETRKQVMSMGAHGFNHSMMKKEILELINSGEENYLTAMCHILDRRRDAIEWRVAETVKHEVDWSGQKHTFTTDYYDMRFKFQLLKGRVHRMIEANQNIYDKVQVEVTTKAMSGVV